MPYPGWSTTLSPALCAICLRYLLLLRLGGLAGGGIAYAGAIALLGLEIPVWPLVAIGTGLVAYTLPILWHLSHGAFVDPEPDEGNLLQEAVIDLLCLTAALYLTGGADNPLITLLLLPVTVVAATQQRWLIWGVTGVAVGCYTLLMTFHRDFPVPSHGPGIFALHVQGMWYGFILNAILIAFFVAKMGAALRTRDRELAQAREEALVENSPAGVAVLSGRQLVFANPRLATLLDTDLAALYEADVFDLVDPEDRPRFVRLLESLEAGDAFPAGGEFRLLSRSGAWRWVSLRLAPIVFRGEPAVLFSLQDIGERKRLEAERHRFSVRRIDIQEAERARIARDLHDGVCQTLTAIRLVLERMLGAEFPAEQRSSMPTLRALIPTLREAVDEVRRISTALRPAMLDDLGLLATTRWWIGELQKIYPAIDFQMRLRVTEGEVPDTLKTPIFRLLQEATNNAARHSGGTLIEVSLGLDATRLILIVADDGDGLDPQYAPPGTLADWSPASAEKADGSNGSLSPLPTTSVVGSVVESRPHLGLLSMSERTELSGGVLSIHTDPGVGTRIEVSWCMRCDLSGTRDPSRSHRPSDPRLCGHGAYASDLSDASPPSSR